MAESPPLVLSKFVARYQDDSADWAAPVAGLRWWNSVEKFLGFGLVVIVLLLITALYCCFSCRNRNLVNIYKSNKNKIQRP